MNIFETYRQRTPNSAAFFRKASGLFPGGVCHNIRDFHPYPFYTTRAEGARLTDADGRTYVDLWMGHYALIFGHGFSGVKDALVRALDCGWHWGTLGEAQIDLAERIQRAIPSMEEMRFCSTGTEATMYAVRLARGFTGKPWILKAAGGWHGSSTDLSFAVREPFHGAEGPGLPPPSDQGVDLLAFNDVDASLRVVEAHRGRIAGIIVEPMIGAGGFLPASRAYLAFLRQVCDDQEAVLIFDEIITGFRFRHGSLADEYGVQPDLTALGKIVGGGLPLGVYGGRREILEAANPRQARRPDRPVLVGGGTFSCNPLAMAAAVATLSELELRGGGLYETLGRRGETVRRGIEDRFADAGIPVSCTGLGSLFMTHVLRGEDRVLLTPFDVITKTLSEVKDRELKVALLNHGVFAVHGGGAISTAHGDVEEETILTAYEKAAEDLGKELRR